jgi:hypothetical protein
VIDLALVAIVAVGSAGSGGVAWALHRFARLRRERLDEHHRAVAAGLGLEYERRRGVPSFEGKVEGVPVRVELAIDVTSVGDVTMATEHTRFEVGAFAPLSVRKGLIAALQQAIEGDKETGDASFDRELFVDGTEALVLGALDADTRVLLRRELAAGTRLESGVLKCERDGHSVKHEAILGVLRPLALLSRRLNLPDEELAPRLAARFRSDPDPSIRVRCLAALLISYRDAPATKEASDGALASGEPGLALLVFKSRGSVPGLRALLRGDGDAVTRAGAAEALTVRSALEPEDEPSLRALLAGDAGRTPAVVKALAVVGTRESVAPLRALGGKLRRPAEDAIERIQSRLASEPGALSLKDGDEAAGRVSLPARTIEKK